LQIKTKIVSSHTADSKPVRQEVNGTVILPYLVFPAVSFRIALTKGKLSLIDEFTLITADEKKTGRRNKKQPKLKSIKNVGPASFGRKPFGRKTFGRETFRRRLHLTNFAM
jgi:hypothetical protein